MRPAVNGLVNPGFVTGPNGEARLLYAGDLQGNMWKFDLSDGINSQKSPTGAPCRSVPSRSSLRQTPGDAATHHDRPKIETGNYGYMVVFGTGKFVEPSDTATAGQQSIYGIWDSWKPPQRTSRCRATSCTSAPPRSLATRSRWEPERSFGQGMGTGQYRGWYLNLPQTRERISVESALGIGAVIFSAAIPEGMLG